MRQHEDFIPPDKKSGFECPVCHHKKIASCRQHNGRWWFKCWNSDCASGTQGAKKAWDEVGYLSFKTGLSATNGCAPSRDHPGRYSDAAIAFMKEANVWTEERTPPSIMPGQKARRVKHAPPMAGAESDGTKTTEGTDTALKDGASGAAATATGPGEEPNAGSHAGETPVDGVAPPIAAGSTPAGAATSEKVESGNAEKLKGEAVPCNAKREEKLCGQPAAWRHPEYPAGAFCEDCKKAAESFFPNNWIPLASAEEPAVTRIANDDELAGTVRAVKQLNTRIGTAKAFNRDTTKYEVALKSTEEAIARYEQERERKKKQLTVKEVPGRRVTREFFAALVLTTEDEARLLAKRGIDSAGCAALGFKSNPKANRKILEALEAEFPVEERLASGIWIRGRAGSVQINKQYCGMGMIGKAEKLKAETLKPGQWVDRQGNLWDENRCPILIPYFDAKGRLLSLRPHKGGGRSSTLCGQPRLYIPRRLGEEREEIHEDVLVSEGEFKGAALWCTVGAGFPDRQATPIGLAMLPGIWFVKNFEIMEELQWWLKAVKCKRLMIVFDNEEKGDPSLPTFKPLVEKRHDVRKCSRYLAELMSRRLHTMGQLGNLPKAWRDANGKADWDGALAALVKS